MNGRTILLVDDSTLVRTMLTEALTQAGFDVVTAADGYEAIESCYTVIPDLIILDIDMPQLKGYQASRLLKARRGVKDIPIIMHTANSEDKDKFWSYNSGASGFVVKDYNNIEPLIEVVRKFIQHEMPDLSAIQEDAKIIDRAFISESICTMFDRELFKSTIMNQLAEAGRSLSSLTATSMRILELLDLACERHAAILLLKYGREIIPYVYPTDSINKEMADDFLSVALDDFYSFFGRNSHHLNDPVYFTIEQRDDWLKIKLGKQQLSSYHYQEIKGSGGETIGTVHIAHMTNNYFSESIVANITCFIREAGVIIHNAMLYKQVTTMERDIRNVFSKFVPPEIINDLVTRKTSATLLGGEKRFVSILFVDIRSFTTMSEENSPEAVVSFLNRYLETMGEIIQDHGGTVDKYIGDAVLAVFGAPKSWPDNAARAIRTALAMSKALRNFPTDSIILPPEGFDIGIGIHCGDAIVGNIGSSSKQDYTVIGDTVNLASRLEGLTRVYRSRILISNEVAKEVGNTDEFSFREVEEVIVKGKGKPTLIHVVEDESTRLLTEEARENYLKGISMYRLRNWKTAAEYFQKVLTEEAEDPLSHIFLERCLSYIDKAPPADWDMVQRYITK